VEGEVGAAVAVVSLPARGRPPEAAARRAGLDLLRCTAQVVEAAVEVSRLEWVR
jgi:hypothetical protein